MSYLSIQITPEVVGYLIFIGTISVSLLFDLMAFLPKSNMTRIKQQHISDFNSSYYQTLVDNPFIDVLRYMIMGLFVPAQLFRLITAPQEAMAWVHPVIFLVIFGIIKIVVHPNRDRLLRASHHAHLLDARFRFCQF